MKTRCIFHLLTFAAVYTDCGIRFAADCLYMRHSLPSSVISNDFVPGGEVHMKRVIGFLMCLLLVATTVMSVSAQDRRRRSRFGRKARTVAIIGGGTVAGALIGGKKGAAIGAGGSTIYAMNRPAARRHFKQSNRRMATVAGGTAAGAGLGAAIGHKRGAAIGALAGGAGSYIYTKKSRHYRRPY
jgi:hypothetical protein